MVKHVYQTKSAVQEYDRSHGLLDCHRREISGARVFFSTVAAEIARFLPNGDNLCLIDLGVGHGGFVFLPFLAALGTPGKKATLTVAVDNSNPMLCEYQGKWKSTFPGRHLRAMVTLPSPGANGDYVVEADIERLLAYHTGDAERFDVVVLTGVLHHTLNWRAVLTSVVEKLLRTTGMIVLAERDMDADFFDGNFYQHLDFIQKVTSVADIRPSDWRRVWTTLYRLRADLGFPWEPEIRISDMTPCIALLLDMGFGHVDGFPKIGCWQNTYTRGELKKWLRNPAFSNFSRGITVKVRKKLVASLSSCAARFAVQESWHYYVLRRP